MKEARNNDVLPSGHIIKKGWIVVWDQYAISRYSPLWPGQKNLEDFFPDRWLQLDMPQTNKPPWIPFHYGPRICLGMKTALSILEGSLQILIRRFQFLPSNVKPHATTAITLKSTTGINLRVRNLD